MTAATYSALLSTTALYRSWQQLPFRQIWVVDTEFYPGPGLANGGVEGDPLTPLCLCALEMRSGRLIRLWQDELGRFPPYRLDNDALFVGHMLSAEFGFHIAKSWGEPACALDTYIEFRHCTNNGTVKSGDREKGFYGMAGALRYFLEDEIDLRRKEDMRDRIMQGPPFSSQERRDIQLYNEDDVQGGVRLLRHIVPMIRSLPHALWRAKFQWAMAQQERRGVPLDGPTLARVHDRNRTPLWAYGTKTARCAPSNSKYIFGPAKWLRFFITPALARVLVHRDFKQQEPRIAAIVSGDEALLQACESDDLYLGIAQQLGFLRDGMNETERKGVRALFKTVVLGIQYGLGARSLAARTGVSISEAAEILARLRSRFRVFEDYARSVLDHAGLKLEIGTPFGWYMQCPSGINPRTVRNFPIQSTGSEILHVACILAERRGIELVAPIHDALLAEGPLDRAEELALALDRLMGDAAAVVLRGYRLPTDFQIIRPGERYYDERGETMWNTVVKLLARRERGAA
jgi:hypothetical protein